MSTYGKYGDPPAYSQSGLQQPQPAYQGYQQSPPPQGYYAAPQMGYYQQGPPPGQYGQQYGPYGPQPYQQQPYGYYDDRRGMGPGACEAMLAAMACCCCLDCLLF